MQSTLTEQPTSSCPCHVQLDDMRLLVRPITPEDKAALVTGFDRMSDQSRRLRFFSPMKSLPGPLLQYLTEVDHDRHEAWIAGDISSNTPAPAGVSRYVKEVDHEGCAEIALTVVDAYQRRGVGSMLLYVLAESAAHHGVEKFTAMVHPDNQPMRKFLARFHAQPVKREKGVGWFQFGVATVLTAFSGEYKFQKRDSAKVAH